MTIKRVELVSEWGIRVSVENDADTECSSLSMGGWGVVLTNKQAVFDQIALLNKALEFWEFDNE